MYLYIAIYFQLFKLNYAKKGDIYPICKGYNLAKPLLFRQCNWSWFILPLQGLQGNPAKGWRRYRMAYPTSLCACLVSCFVRSCQLRRLASESKARLLLIASLTIACAKGYSASLLQQTRPSLALKKAGKQICFVGLRGN